ncbi:MFS transporter, partial [Sinomonas sp.]|uniref:MFS transporter n=1 Tax=Sinomonas sp. TaxID=1914986 RepID=UPI003F822A08
MSVQAITREQAARRATFASVVGTTIEWYDFFLYGTAAALVFPQLFFPGGEGSFNGIIAAFGTQFIGFVARPIGAAIFGHFGDRIGRKATLMATLFLMAIGTVLIGVLPTYQAIGVWAPLLLTALRVVQGIGVGGEWGGSVLIAMEWGHQQRRGLAASWPQLGVPLGLVLSTGLVRLTTGLTGADFFTYGWRIPFLLSFVLIAVGLFVRLRVVESPEFEAVRKTRKVIRTPLIEALRRQPQEIILSALLRTAEQAPFYLFITFVITYATNQLKFSSDAILVDTLIAAALGLVSIPLFGRLSDRFGRRLVYGIGIVGTA